MKSAIMPVDDGVNERYVELICVEMPDVRFEDIIVFKLGRGQMAMFKVIDSTFLKVCEDDSIQPVGVAVSVPIKVGAYVRADKLFVEIDEPHAEPVEVVVKISGLRRGMGTRRFASHTREEMIKNNMFWDQWSR